MDRRFGVEIEFVVEGEERPCSCYECRTAREDDREEGTLGGDEWEDECDDDYREPMGQDAIADALVNAGIPCRASEYSHETTSGWKIVRDGSVPQGWELVSPPMYWDDRGDIETVCEVLRELGAEVDESCGLHVHHEVRDLDVSGFKRLVRNWAAWQDHTDRLTAPERRDGQWSHHLDDYLLNHIGRAEDPRHLADLCGDLDRYHALNVSCYPSYGTVEIRQHEGTLDAEEILAWVAYGQAVIEAGSESSVGRGVTFRSFLDALPFLRNEDRESLKAEGGVLTA